MVITTSPLRRGQAGFTLIELLIVISIIGILSTIASLSLGASQQRARDGQRKADLKQVQNALEIYYNNNQNYPASTGTGAITNGAWGSSWVSGSVNYMRLVPTDPLSGGSYCYSSAGTSSYSLYAKLENTSDPDKSGPYTCNGVTTYNFLLQNPF